VDSRIDSFDTSSSDRWCWRMGLFSRLAVCSKLHNIDSCVPYVEWSCLGDKQGVLLSLVLAEQSNKNLYYKNVEFILIWTDLKPKT
jgi:hypothetical protein